MKKPMYIAKSRRNTVSKPQQQSFVNETALVADLRMLIQSARQRVATVANSTQTLLYWHVGQRLLKETLQDSRAV